MAKTGRGGQRPSRESECVIPSTPPERTTRTIDFSASPHDSTAIRQYVQSQVPNEKIEQVEFMKSERVLGTKHDCWNVKTDRSRWWVITNPTNLYAQEHLPNLDFTLTVHIGLAARAVSQRVPKAETEQQSVAIQAWRKWVQTAEAFDRSEEVEDFQAVGMRCREALLTLATVLRVFVDPLEEMDEPKKGDFVGWSTNVIQRMAQGSSAEEVRRYLTGHAKATWQLVNWLTHSSSAIRTDAELALEATHHTLERLTALVAKGRAAPFRCFICGSIAFDSVYTVTGEMKSFRCTSCGWDGIIESTKGVRSATGARTRLRSHHPQKARSEKTRRKRRRG